VRNKTPRLLNELLELYDLKTDIGEENNLADKHPDVIADIEAYLKTARIDSYNWPLRATKS